MQPPPDLRLELTNDPAEVTRAAAAVSDWLAPLAPSARAQFVIDLVIEEIALNIVRHAFAPDTPAGSRRFHLVAHASQSPAQTPTLELAFDDDGVAFDPVRASEPDLSLPLEQRPIGGLGIHMVRQMAPDMAYERTAGRNRLRVKIPLCQAPA